MKDGILTEQNQSTGAELPELSDRDKLVQFYHSIPEHVGTPRERKVLAAKLLPEADDWSVVRICAAWGLDRKVWYRLHKKPEFLKRCITYAHQFKSGYVPQILRSLIKSAVDGNVQAQMALLKDAGILKPEEQGTTSIALNINNNTISYDRSQFTDEQRKAQHANIGATFGRSNRFVSN